MSLVTQESILAALEELLARREEGISEEELELGVSVYEVARHMKISHAYAGRILREATDSGLLKRSQATRLDGMGRRYKVLVYRPRESSGPG